MIEELFEPVAFEGVGQVRDIEQLLNLFCFVIISHAQTSLLTEESES